MDDEIDMESKTVEILVILLTFAILHPKAPQIKIMDTPLREEEELHNHTQLKKNHNMEDNTLITTVTKTITRGNKTLVSVQVNIKA